MFSFFIENGLISQNQSGSKPGDSCINQLLSITYEIYKSFEDDWKEVLSLTYQKLLTKYLYYLN